MGKLGDVALGVCPRCGEENGQILIAKRNYRGQMSSREITPTLCNSCQTVLDNSATLICNGCSSVVAKIESGLTPDGFQIEEKGTYHSPSCPKCSSSKKVEILEIKEFFETLKGGEG